MSASAEYAAAMAAVGPVAVGVQSSLVRTARAWLRLTDQVVATDRASPDARIEAVIAVRDAQHSLRRLADLLGEIGLRFDAALGAAAGDEPQ